MSVSAVNGKEQQERWSSHLLSNWKQQEERQRAAGLNVSPTGGDASVLSLDSGPLPGEPSTAPLPTVSPSTQPPYTQVAQPTPSPYKIDIVRTSTVSVAALKLREQAQQRQQFRPRQQEYQPQNSVRTQEPVWTPETFGYDIGARDANGAQNATNVNSAMGLDGKRAVIEEFADRATLPLMALKDIAKKPGQAKSAIQSEVSGAAGNAGFVGFGNIISIALKYIATFLIQYGFGVGLYGLYTLSSSLINLVASVLNLGLDDAMVRYTAIYRSKHRLASLQALTIFCTALAGIAGIIGAGLLLFYTPALATLWSELKHHGQVAPNAVSQTIPLLQIMAPIVPLLCMQAIWFGGLRGFKAFKWRTITMSVIQPLVQIILLIFVLRYFRSISSVALVMLISTTVTAILNLYFLFRQVEAVATAEPRQYESREWLSFASFNFLTTIIDTVLDSIDTILLAAFGLPNSQLGEYGAAIRLSSFIALPILTLNNIFAPMIAELHSKGEKEKLESMFKVVTKWSITFSLPICLVTTVFSPYLLGVAGIGYVAAWPLVIGLAAGSMLNACTGSVGYMLLMTGYQRLSFVNSMVAVVTNIVLGIILTPHFGAMGTAISTGLAIAVMNLMRLLQVRLLLKMHPYRWDIIKPIGAGLLSALPTGGLLFLLSHIKSSFMIGHALISFQLLLIPVFLAGYAGLLVLFKASPEDEIVLKALRKKLRRGTGNNKNGKKKHMAPA